MNRYTKTILGTLAALAFTVQAQAATIWAPTDVTTTGNVNVIQVPGIPTLDLNGGSLALFADTDTTFSTPLVLGSIGGTFDFQDNLDGTYNVTAVVNNAPVDGPLVINGYEFLLAVTWGSGYFGDSAAAQSGGDPTSFLLSFTDGGANSGSLLAVDLTPVPLPAAAWLLGTALLGLAGVARRKA